MTALDGELLERDDEVAACTTALEQARGGHGRVLVLQGPPGIGKTTLLRVTCRAAAELGMRVLEARGGELEREFAFGVVRQVFEPVVADDADALLTGSARLAAHVLGHADDDAPGAAGDLGPTLHGLYWVASNLTETQPALVAVDDVQWADEASLAFCHYLARRVAHLPIVLLLAERRPETGLERSVVSGMVFDPATTALQPEPLSASAVGQLVRTAAADAEGAFCSAVHEASGGNPLLVHALMEEAGRAGVSPTAAHIDRLHELAPEVVRGSVSNRLDRLPLDCRRLAEAAAVLGRGAHLRLAAELAELDQDKAAVCADALVTAGILSTARPVDFFHPLLRQAVYAELASGHRALLHGRAGRLLDAAAAPLTAVAAHLLATEPTGDRWALEVLRRAASEALSEGLPATAVNLLTRALAEPPDPAHRADVLLELGLAHAHAAEVEEAMSALDEALRLGVPPERRIEAGIVLSRMVGMLALDVDAGLRVLDELAGTALDHELEAQIAVERARTLTIVPVGPELPEPAELRTLGEIAGPQRGQALSLAALLALLAGEPAAAARDLAEQAVDTWSYSSAGGWPDGACYTLIYTDAFDRADEVLSALMAEGQRCGNVYLFGAPSVWRGHLRYRLGQLADAEADCVVVRDIILSIDAGYALSFPSTFLAEIAMERGDLEQAEAYLGEVLPGPWGHTVWYLHARGRLRSAQGRLDEALEDFAVLIGLADRLRSPAYAAWRSDLALTLERAERHDEAVRWATEEVELARAQGAPRAVGMALRALGVVEGGQAGLAHLQESVDVLARTPAALEHARALCELGAALRRARRPKDAREPLRHALDLAHRCGATALVERAQEELSAAGAKPRRIAVTGVDALTPRERKVAQLAADGLTNKQVAEALFVSTWTVASQLTAAYQKLQISGRAELADALGSPSG